jgi:hypothetical protein
MAVVAEKIEARGDSAPQEGDWMYDWHLDDATNIINSRRHTYFAEVAAEAEKLLLDNSEVLEKKRVSYKLQDIAVDTNLDSATVWHKRLFAFKLSQILKERHVKWFLLAVDECSELNSTPVSGAKPMSLGALQRIIKAYDYFVSEVPVWFLLLDTDSSIIDMSPLGTERIGSRKVTGHCPLGRMLDPTRRLRMMCLLIRKNSQPTCTLCNISSCMAVRLVAHLCSPNFT